MDSMRFAGGADVLTPNRHEAVGGIRHGKLAVSDAVPVSSWGFSGMWRKTLRLISNEIRPQRL
jgi:hypothetical protein